MVLPERKQSLDIGYKLNVYKAFFWITYLYPVPRILEVILSKSCKLVALIALHYIVIVHQIYFYRWTLKENVRNLQKLKLAISI